MLPDSPSATARMVARGVVFIAGDPRWRHLVPPEMARETRTLLAACSPTERRWLHLLERPAFRGLVAFTEEMIAPGILRHYVLRKRSLEEAARAALQEGFQQVVVLGAGLDTLALRLHRTHPDVSFLEIDHPATQPCKRASLPMDTPNLHLIAADLGRCHLPDVLAACPAYDPNADTLFLAEGLLMYFPAWQVRTLLSGVRDAVCPGAHCRLGFTFVEPYLDGHPDFSHASYALRLWLHRRGEPFRWGLYRDELPSLLTDRGFTVRAVATPEELRERYLPSETKDRVSGDSICLADRKSNGGRP